ncbi:hypothetical protein [Clostridium sp.]
MYKEGVIFINGDKKSLNMKARHGMEIHVIKSADNKNVLEAIV